MISCNFEERFPPKFQCVSSMTFPMADPIFSQIGWLGFEQSFFKNSNNERFWTNPLQPGYRMHRVPNRFGPTMISWNFDKRFPPKFVCVSSMTFSTADPNFIQIGRLGLEKSFTTNSSNGRFWMHRIPDEFHLFRNDYLRISQLSSHGFW